MHHVFVFGTLKRGFPNFHYNKGEKLPGSFSTLHAYPLYLVGPRYVPWLLDKAGHGQKVRGEIYQVTPEQLELLDRLERVGQPDGYRRKKITCKKTSGDQQLEVFVYLKPVQQLQPSDIMLGPLSCYLPEHAQHYRTR